MPERDANQLAADDLDILLNAYQHNRGERERARDRLVGLVGTLQQERDAATDLANHYARTTEGYADRAVAAEAALARAEADPDGLEETVRALQLTTAQLDALQRRVCDCPADGAFQADQHERSCPVGAERAWQEASRDA